MFGKSRQQLKREVETLTDYIKRLEKNLDEISKMRLFDKSPSPYEKTITSETKIYNAPTVDSVKLYSEMKDKSIRSIVNSFRLDSDLFSCVCIVFNEYDLIYNFAIKYRINGVDRNYQYAINKHEIVDCKDINEIKNMVFSLLLDSATEKFRELFKKDLRDKLTKLK